MVAELHGAFSGARTCVDGHSFFTHYIIYFFILIDKESRLTQDQSLYTVMYLARMYVGEI